MNGTMRLALRGDASLPALLGLLILPVQLTVPPAPARAAAADQVIEAWARRELEAWPSQAKVAGPRIALAKLIVGRDLDAVQAYFQDAQPWAGVGSDWAGHKGDYDFTTITLAAILHRFGDRPDRLTPKTRDHLLDHLLILTGPPGAGMTPNTFGLLPDTENHVLMTEVSRYLTNQWRHQHEDPHDPHFDNNANGMTDWMAAHLDRLIARGFYEFNSMPYEGYTLQALLTLEAHAEPKSIRTRARRLLDRLVWHAALSSVGPRRAGPFRRRMNYVGTPHLWQHAISAMVSVWAGWDEGGRPPLEQPRSSDRLIAAAMPYRPPAQLLAWFTSKPRDYLAKIGHGRFASPEIVSGGPGYVLVAGGAGRGPAAQVIPRPTTLLLDDGAGELRGCFHLPGRGEPLGWNNTGVHRRFACGPAGVRVPPDAVPMTQSDHWRIYETGGPRLAVHEQDGLGLLLVLPAEQRAADWLRRLEASNPDPAALRTSFQWPGGERVTYDVAAPPGAWVIRAVDGRPVDRDYDRWPHEAAAHLPPGTLP